MDYRLKKCGGRAGEPERCRAKKRPVTAYLENWIKHEADKARKVVIQLIRL